MKLVIFINVSLCEMTEDFQEFIIFEFSRWFYQNDSKFDRKLESIISIIGVD